MKSITYTLRRSEFFKNGINSSDITGFKSYDAALEQMKRIAAANGVPVMKDEKGFDVIEFHNGVTDILVWIFGETDTLVNHRPSLFEKVSK